MAETVERTDGDRAELSQAAAELNLMEFWEERADLELLRPRKGAMPVALARHRTSPARRRQDRAA